MAEILTDDIAAARERAITRLRADRSRPQRLTLMPNAHDHVPAIAADRLLPDGSPVLVEPDDRWVLDEMLPSLDEIVTASRLAGGGCTVETPQTP